MDDIPERFFSEHNGNGNMLDNLASILPFAEPQEQASLLDRMIIEVPRTENITTSIIETLISLTGASKPSDVRLLAVTALSAIIDFHEVNEEGQILDLFKQLAVEDDGDRGVMARATEGLLNFLRLQDIPLSPQTDLVNVTKYDNSEANYTIIYLGDSQSPIPVKAHAFAFPRNLTGAFLEQFADRGAQVLTTEQSDILTAIPFQQTNYAVVYGTTSTPLDIHTYNPPRDRTTEFDARDENAQDLMTDYLGPEDGDDYDPPNYARRDPQKTLRADFYPSLTIEFLRECLVGEVIITEQPVTGYKIVPNSQS